jgi:excisionase family DNA binding protein
MQQKPRTRAIAESFPKHAAPPAEVESSHPAIDPALPKPVFITVRQASALLNVPEFRIQRAARAQRIPSYRFLGRKILLQRDEIIAVVSASRRGPL